MATAKKKSYLDDAVATARVDIQRATDSLHLQQRLADYDPFADPDEDNNELEGNEVVLDEDC